MSALVYVFRTLLGLKRSGQKYQAQYEKTVETKEVIRRVTAGGS